MQGFPEEGNEVFQSPKPAGRAYVAYGYQCVEIISRAELCAIIVLMLWVGAGRMGAGQPFCLECWQEEAWGRHRKTLVAESTRRKEGTEAFLSSPSCKEMAFFLHECRFPRLGKGQIRAVFY